MEKKFTKGEWSIDIESDGNIWIITDSSVAAIANVCSGFNDVTKRYKPEDGELANAKLIAAAPEMFKKHDINVELCDELLNAITAGKENLALRILAQIKSNSISAIKKATE